MIGVTGYFQVMVDKTFPQGKMDRCKPDRLVNILENAVKAADWRLEYEVDGIMIGRAAIGYPWIFRELKHFFKTGELLPGPTIAERVDVCRTHLDKSIEWKGPKTGIFEMRRHYSNYFKGIPDFKEYRMKLVSMENIQEIHRVLEDILLNFEPELV